MYTEMTLERLQDIFEAADWRVVSKEIHNRHDGSRYIEIENWSPAGEDLVETIELTGSEEELKNELWMLYYDFDPDEHAEMWIAARGTRGVPSSIRVLINDADAIEQMYLDLYNAVTKYLEAA